MGVPLALVVMVIYFHRLAVYKLPSQEVIVSVFLPLGPMGQGGYGIMALGSQAMRVFPETKTLHPSAGDIMYVHGFGVAIILWGFGLVWLFFAIASISRSKFPFNMGWWGFTFPIGVFAMSTLTLGQELPSALFRILGTVSCIASILVACISNLLTGFRSMCNALVASCSSRYDQEPLIRQYDRGPMPQRDGEGEEDVSGE
jgi:tellurite resistance protein TehA-like permease